MTEKNPRGRPRHHAEKMTKRGVSMPPEYWQQAEALGGGEASAGIRRALEIAQANDKAKEKE